MKTRLLLLCLLVLAIRYLFFTHGYLKNPHSIIWPDTASYVMPAESLLAGRGLMLHASSNIPDTVRTPGYPMFIALIYRLLGPQMFWLSLIQIPLSVLTILFVYRMALWFSDERAAFWCALVYSLDPLSAYFSQMALTETLFTFVLVLAVFYLFRAFNQTGENKSFLTDSLLSGLFFAYAAHIRPLAYLLAPVLSLAVFLFGRSSAISGKQRTAIIICLLIPWLVFVGGWQLRNFHRAGTWKFSNIDSINRWLYEAPDIVAKRENTTSQEVRKTWSRRLPPGVPWGDPRTYAWYDRQTWPILRDNWGWVLYRRLGFIPEFLFDTWDIRTVGYAGLDAPHTAQRTFFLMPFHLFVSKWIPNYWQAFCVFAFTLVYLSFVYFALIGGLIRRSPSKHLQYILLILILYLAVLSLGPQGGLGRFRVPVMPFLCVLAAPWFVRTNKDVPPSLNTADQPLTQLKGSV